MIRKFLNMVAVHIEVLSAPLKGQSHKKVGEMRVQGDSLGPS
jgi:hypothetical protein